VGPGTERGLFSRNSVLFGETLLAFDLKLVKQYFACLTLLGGSLTGGRHRGRERVCEKQREKQREFTRNEAFRLRLRVDFQLLINSSCVMWICL